MLIYLLRHGLTAYNAEKRYQGQRDIPLSPEGRAQLRQADLRPRTVYITIDLDCLDPSCFPGTGTPEAGGVSFLQLLDAIRTVSKANIVGADLNELAPMLDISGVSTATACKVLRELLIALDKGWPGFQV